LFVGFQEQSQLERSFTSPEARALYAQSIAAINVLQERFPHLITVSYDTDPYEFGKFVKAGMNTNREPIHTDSNNISNNEKKNVVFLGNTTYDSTVLKERASMHRLLQQSANPVTIEYNSMAVGADLIPMHHLTLQAKNRMREIANASTVYYSYDINGNIGLDVQILRNFLDCIAFDPKSSVHSIVDIQHTKTTPTISFIQAHQHHIFSFIDQLQQDRPDISFFAHRTISQALRSGDSTSVIQSTIDDETPKSNAKRAHTLIQAHQSVFDLMGKKSSYVGKAFRISEFFDLKNPNEDVGMLAKKVNDITSAVNHITSALSQSKRLFISERHIALLNQILPESYVLMKHGTVASKSKEDTFQMLKTSLKQVRLIQKDLERIDLLDLTDEDIGFVQDVIRAISEPKKGKHLFSTYPLETYKAAALVLVSDILGSALAEGKYPGKAVSLSFSNQEKLISNFDDYFVLNRLDTSINYPVWIEEMITLVSATFATLEEYGVYLDHEARRPLTFAVLNSLSYRLECIEDESQLRNTRAYLKFLRDQYTHHAAQRIEPPTPFPASVTRIPEGS
jgi:hypothetical protein